jgi:hypothetical protein
MIFTEGFISIIKDYPILKRKVSFFFGRGGKNVFNRDDRQQIGGKRW